MSKFKTILKNEYVFSVVTKFATIAISLLHSIVVARYLGASLKGSNAYIGSIVAFGSIIVTFGMHQAYPYYRKVYGKDNLFDDYMSLIFCIYGVYAILAIVISAFVFQSLELKAAMLIIPLQSFCSVLSYVTLIEWPNTRNAKHAVVTVLNLVFALALCLFTESSFFWSIAILVFADIVQIFVYAQSLKFKFKLSARLLRLAKEIFSFGFLPMLALLMTNLNYKVDILMLRQYKTLITTAMIGVYSIGMNVADHISLIPDTLKWVLVSKLAKGKDESEVARVSRLSFWASILMCLGLIVFGRPLIEMLYGAEYAGGYKVLLICAFGTVFIGHFQMVAQYNIINKKQILNVLMLSISVLVNVALNLALIPRYQLAGAAFASGVGYFTSGIVFVLWFTRKSGIRISEMFLPQKDDIALLKGMHKHFRNKA